MRGPPDLKSERAALAGSPVSQNHLPCTENTNEMVPNLQAEHFVGDLFLLPRCRDRAPGLGGCPR